MKNAVAPVVTAILLLGAAATAAYAQKGVGDATGVARQPAAPKIVSLEGKIIEVRTGPCEATTGRAVTGTHVILETAQKEQLNVHLGPAEAVGHIVARLAVGQPITVKAFRTEQMKEQHYVAQSLTFGKTTVELRDASLRPVWALSNTDPRGQAAGPPGFGRGRGPGWGRGMGWGRGGRGWAAPSQPEPALAQERPGKIAVTAVAASMDAAVDPRFGRCSYILLVDAERETFEALKNPATAGGSAGVEAAQMIAAKGAKVLLTGECGPKAAGSLAAAGIQVVPGCSGSVRAVIQQFKAGKLQPAGKPAAPPGSASGQQPAAPKQP